MTRIIGLTGGIGSGKTTVAGYFASWGVPVYYADDEAKKILYLPEAAGEVQAAFGEGVFTDGLPDRQKIAALVFSDPAKLAQLNAIIHPRVKQHFLDWVAAHKESPFVIKEAAILFESGSHKDCDAVILVTAPKEERIRRVIQRDDTSREKVLERMANQWDEDKKVALSDYIIENLTPEKAKKNALSVFKIITNSIL